jgi:hypothetical protein
MNALHEIAPTRRKHVASSNIQNLIRAFLKSYTRLKRNIEFSQVCTLITTGNKKTVSISKCYSGIRL